MEVSWRLRKVEIQEPRPQASSGVSPHPVLQAAHPLDNRERTERGVLAGASVNVLPLRCSQAVGLIVGPDRRRHPLEGLKRATPPSRPGGEVAPTFGFLRRLHPFCPHPGWAVALPAVTDSSNLLRLVIGVRLSALESEVSAFTWSTTWAFTESTHVGGGIGAGVGVGGPADPRRCQVDPGFNTHELPPFSSEIHTTVSPSGLP